MQPFITVVIPTLNEEEYLPRLLNDLTSQSLRNFEVIVVDAKSEDQTVERAQAFLDKLPLKILESKKKNVSWQRNLGAANAKGTYLVFFDADVQVSPTYLFQLREQLEKTKTKFATTYLKSDSRNIYDKVIAAVYNLALEGALFVEKPFVPGFNFIVHRQTFHHLHGFREEVIHGEDYDLSMRIYASRVSLIIFRTPLLTFSLRRFRAEGRLSVIRKHAVATLHIFTKGQITQSLFDYPMGGGWYKTFKKENNHGRTMLKAERYAKRLIKFFLE